MKTGIWLSEEDISKINEKINKVYQLYPEQFPNILNVIIKDLFDHEFDKDKCFNQDTQDQITHVLLNVAAKREEELLELIRVLWTSMNPNDLDRDLTEQELKLINLSMDKMWTKVKSNIETIKENEDFILNLNQKIEE